VGLGNRGQEEYEDDTDLSGEVKRAKPDEDEKETGEVGVDGSYGDEWKVSLWRYESRECRLRIAFIGDRTGLHPIIAP